MAVIDLKALCSEVTEQQRTLVELSYKSTRSGSLIKSCAMIRRIALSCNRSSTIALSKAEGGSPYKLSEATNSLKEIL